MEEKALKLIYQICPKDYLMEALFYKDYYTGIEVLNEELDSINEITSMFTVFDELDKALETGSVIEVMNVLNMCERGYTFCLAIDIVNELNAINSEDLDDEDRMEYESELVVAVHYLTNYFNVTRKEKFEFAEKLLKRVNKKYTKVKALEQVYSLPFMGDNVVDDISKFTEDLIYGGEVTMYNVWESIIDCNPDQLMEQMQVMRFLREKYYALRENEVRQLQSKINNILDFGLKRKTTNR